MQIVYYKYVNINSLHRRYGGSQPQVKIFNSEDTNEEKI